jgi:phosphohistidine phosphatase
MDLFLVQHGESTSSEQDPTRPLTGPGAEAVQNMAAFAARAGIQVDEVRHSGKLRAKQTAEILAGPLEPRRGVNAAIGLDPGDDVQPVADLLQRGGGSVMLVGHLPFLARLAGLLLANDPEVPVVHFRNAGIVHLVRENHNDGRWSVVWAVTPEFVL